MLLVTAGFVANCNQAWAGKWHLGMDLPRIGKPRSKPGDRPFQLYDIHADPAETTNLIDKHPETAARLEQAMEELKK